MTDMIFYHDDSDTDRICVLDWSVTDNKLINQIMSVTGMMNNLEDFVTDVKYNLDDSVTNMIYNFSTTKDSSRIIVWYG